MQCDICHRALDARVQFNCTSCARNALYGPRIQQARALLEVETLGQEVEKNVKSSRHRIKNLDKLDGAFPTYTIELACAEKVELEDRTDTILAQADLLRGQTEELKAYMDKKKAELSKRRSTLSSATRRLSKRADSEFEPLQKDTTRTKSHWDALHTKTAEARNFLCREAAQLYGLQQRRGKKGGIERDVYLIGGSPIIDLRDLNSLRLPAEITLPHRDYPLSTILSPGSSYTSRDIPYPGLTPSHSSSNSPSASRAVDLGPLPRPRPLHLEKKLAILAKQDPVAYASFVEGVTLLAWDIAWMGKTQGLEIGKFSWEDVCALGKNLWQLLLGPRLAPQRQSPAKVSVQPITSRLKSVPEKAVRSPHLPVLGHFSHSTAHSFLPAFEGVEHMSEWRLQSPVKVIDKVKAMLLTERDGAEWQILREDEWEEENLVDETGLNQEEYGKATRETILIDGIGEEPSLDVPSENLYHETEQKGEGEQDRSKGTSGWTKLKSRGVV
ncbi:MAG: hypothetical protein Q9191_003726 [Dirinaria sp. TL-2023a]